jgi:L-ascorbate metabolism protein UlaG (beta-lactamase superfamily)
MELRSLGWAGVQLRSGDASLVIDPLEDAAAVWAAAGDLAKDVPLPAVVAAEGEAGVALVTHLHRDHADAAALTAALAAGAPVLAPLPFGGGDIEEAGVAGAAAELAAAGLDVRGVAPWERVEIGGWEITALPAADGAGDPQVSWLVSRDGTTVVHAGDTLRHGWWWRVAQRAPSPIDVAFLPVNGARISFPHRRPAGPLPAVMTAAEAAVVSDTLRARRLVPMHYGAYTFPPIYVPDEDPLTALIAAAPRAEVLTPALGEWFEA